MKRILLASFGLLVLTLVMAVQANEPNRPATKPGAQGGKFSKEELAQQERVLAERYRKFEQALLTLKDRLARSDRPEDKARAKVLEKALEASGNISLATKFDQFVKFLETAKVDTSLSGAKQAAAEAAALAKGIKEILDILSGDGGASAKREERMNLEKLVKELERVIRDQKLVRGQVDAGVAKKEVQGNQDQVTKDTKGILDKVGDKTGPGNEAKNDKAESKEGGKGKGDKGDAKDAGKAGEAKSGNSKDAGKDSKADKGGAKAGDKSEAGDAKSSKGGEGAKSDAKGSKGGDGDKSGAKDPGKGDDKDNKGGAKEPGKEPGKDGEQGSKVKTKDEDKKADGDKAGSKKGDPKGGESGAKKGGDPKGGDPKGDKGGDKSASKGGDKGGEQGQSKPGKSSSGQGEPKPGGEQGGDPGQSKDDNQPKAGQNQDPTQQAKQRIKEGNEHQQQAGKNIAKNDKPGTTKEIEKAIDKLEDAKKKLEELLRQLREEELERLLAALQQRCEKMLAMQIEVYNGTVAVDRAILGNDDKKPTRQNTQTSLKLSDDEGKIVTEATKAIEMLEAEGSAVAFPEVFQQVREDMKNVARRLGAVDPGKVTQVIEQDIIDTLKEMIEALKKAQKELQDKKSPPSDPKGQPPPQADQKLLDQIAELKMIRSMQVRVNKRTEHYGKQYTGEQANQPDIVGELNQLAGRQERIFDVTRRIATGENK
jgi:hypothetical protein